MVRTSRSRGSTSTSIIDLTALALNPPGNCLKHLMDRLLRRVSMILLLDSSMSAKDRLLEILVFSQLDLVMLEMGLETREVNHKNNQAHEDVQYTPGVDQDDHLQ